MEWKLGMICKWIGRFCWFNDMKKEKVSGIVWELMENGFCGSEKELEEKVWEILD
jgi:hypothetical protein